MRRIIEFFCKKKVNKTENQEKEGKKKTSKQKKTIKKK